MTQPQQALKFAADAAALTIPFQNFHFATVLKKTRSEVISSLLSDVRIRLNGNHIDDQWVDLIIVWLEESLKSELSFELLLGSESEMWIYPTQSLIADRAMQLLMEYSILYPLHREFPDYDSITKITMADLLSGKSTVNLRKSSIMLSKCRIKAGKNSTQNLIDNANVLIIPLHHFQMLWTWSKSMPPLKKSRASTSHVSGSKYRAVLELDIDL